MSTAATFIPTFAAIVLILGGANELSIQLMLVGTFAIIIHTTMSPVDFYNPYPNFDNYRPEQPPFRDYLLVFGLAGLVLVALFSRIHPLLSSLVRATWRNLAPGATTTRRPSSWVQDASTSRPSPSSTSPSHTFTDQWTATASTLVDRSPASTTRTTRDRPSIDAAEIAALKARVFQLEAAMDNMRCRLDTLTAGQKDTDVASGITTTIVAESSPPHTPPPTNLDAAAPSSDSSPSPADPNSTSESADARKHLRSIVGCLMEGTQQTDQLILKMRTILAEANATSDGDNSLSGPPATTSTESSFVKHVPSSSSATPIAPSPSPPTHPEALRTSTIRRTRIPIPSPVTRASETPGTPGAPEFNSTLDLLGISKVPCSTPVRSAKELEQSTPSFLGSPEVDSGRQSLFAKPVFKRPEGADARARPVGRAASILSRVTPENATLRYARLRLRERSSMALSLPPARSRPEPTQDSRRDAKGKGRAVTTLSDWLAEYRRKRDGSRVSHPLHRDCGG